jgi:uncharacterized protein (TIGR02646 family)
MRAITKGPEPATLQAYRSVPGATYDGKDFTPVKHDIRGALQRDQHALCCYCMRRISSEERAHPTKPDVQPIVQMKVEHWKSQDEHPDLQLAWSNMLGACLGGMGQSPQDQTCDTRKGDSKITLDPLNPMHVSTIYCTSAGRLLSTNLQFQKDIDERLGLNHRILVAARQAQFKRDIKRLTAKYPTKNIPLGALQRTIAEVEASTEGKLPELACVLRLWTRKRHGTELP